MQNECRTKGNKVCLVKQKQANPVIISAVNKYEWNKLIYDFLAFFYLKENDYYRIVEMTLL